MAQTLTRHDSEQSTASSSAFLEQLFPAPRSFCVRFWDGSQLCCALASPTVTLVLNHPGALRRMFKPPIELSLGEAYIFGDFDIDGDVFAAARVFNTLMSHPLTLAEITNMAREFIALPTGDPPQPTLQRAARLSGARHTQARDQSAIQYHYDVGNAFYALWLDRTMQYSCAYLPTAESDLDTAQERKMSHICRKLRLKRGDTLLDIGCGWGGLARFAVEHFDANVVGVTLSRQQFDYARAENARLGMSERVDIKLADYRSLPAATFDKIVSVGMFEHVGRDHLPEYFEHAYRLLRAGGLFLNHGISVRATDAYGLTAHGATESHAKSLGLPRVNLTRRLVGEGTFAQRYVFPDGEVVPVSEANLVAEQAGFEVRDVENLREHYALTLRQWVSRLEAARTEAVASVGETTYRTWRLYMAIAGDAFESGKANLNQTLFAKLDEGRCGLPLSRSDLYAVNSLA